MRVLFLTHRLPYAPNRGDRIRAYHLAKQMSRFATVSLFSFVHDEDEAGRAGDVPFAEDVTTVRVTRARNLVRGALRLAGPQPLTHALLDAPGASRLLAAQAERTRPDVAVAFCSGMARFTTTGPLRHLPSVLDMVDVDSVKWTEMAATAGGVRGMIYRREADRLGRFEREASHHARAVLVVNERERLALAGIAGQARIEVVENGVDVEAFRPAGDALRLPHVIFCGVMDYEPNARGVDWFAREVWPLVRRERPDARFQVVGPRPSPATRALGEADSTIEILGGVPETQPFLWRAAVSVAPLQVARGLQNKVLEAAAAGLPVVVSAAVADGLPAEVAAACATADDPHEFSRHVLRYLAERTGAVGGLPIDLQDLTWPKRLGRVESILRAAAQRP